MYRKSGFRPERFGSDDEYFSTGGWKKIKSRAGKGKVNGKGKASRKQKDSAGGGPTEQASLFVLGQDGMPLYLCGEKKADKVKAGIVATLPHDAYCIRGKTIRLARDVHSIGFESSEEFTKWCTSLATVSKKRLAGSGASDGGSARGNSNKPKKPCGNARTKRSVTNTARRVRKKEWHRVEDEALRRQFAIGETEMYQIKQAIPYRTNADIKLRIQELGLDRADEGDGTESMDALRYLWSLLVIGLYYKMYGPDWDWWELILPWLDASMISGFADDIGCGDVWTDDERLSLLEGERGKWTLEELNILISYSPLLDDDNNELWEVILPSISREERCKVQKQLNIPTRGKIEECAHAASKLV